MKKVFRTHDYDPDPDRDLAEELQSHRELLVEDLMAEGMTEAEARAEADNRLEHPAEALAEAAPQARSRELRRRWQARLEVLRQDIRYAFRRMARRPGFTGIAILSLALGIGANTAVFSLVNAFLIRKAPFRDPGELVRIYSNAPDRPNLSTSYPDFQDMQGMGDAFSGVGVSHTEMAVVELDGEPTRVIVEATSANLFRILGVEPVLGRNFLPQEDRIAGETTVAILGHSFWRQAYGGDPGILGRTLTLAGLRYTVVGVAPAWLGSVSFAGFPADLFIPATMASAAFGYPEDSYRDRYATQFEVTARLAPGVTLEEGRARLDLLASQLQEAYPETNGRRSFTALPRNQVIFGPDLDPGLRMVAVFLLVVVGLVLLLACTNLASFLLARGIEGRKETAMRMALGAGRGRLIRQTLTETLLLGLMGGAAGVLVARIALAFVVAVQPPIPISLSLDLGMDGRVFLFSLGVSGLAGIFFGLAPALQGTRLNLTPTLKEGGGDGSRKRHRLLTGLVGLQVMVSTILLVGGGLFIRSLMAVQSVDPGFSTDEAGIAWLDLSGSRIPGEEFEPIRLDLQERLLAQPGIRTVTFCGSLPLSLGGSVRTFRIPGVEPPPGREGHRLGWNPVSPNYFEAMSIPILKGRGFTDEDRDASTPVVVVSQEAARSFWPEDDPLGKQIYQGQSRTPLTIVGVAGDVKVGSMGEAPAPFVYRPATQAPAGSLQVLVRGPVPVRELTGTLRRVIREAYPTMVVMEVKTMEEHLSVRLFGTRAAAALLGGLGALGLLLSTLGLYGVVSFSVSRRVREMGIRMSLGASGARVVTSVMRRALTIVLAGGSVGLALAWVLARLVRSFLVGISPADPVALVAVPILLGVVAALAALIPAMRATRVDPARTLRAE